MLVSMLSVADVQMLDDLAAMLLADGRDYAADLIWWALEVDGGVRPGGVSEDE